MRCLSSPLSLSLSLSLSLQKEGGGLITGEEKEEGRLLSFLFLLARREMGKDRKEGRKRCSFAFFSFDKMERTKQLVFVVSHLGVTQCFP